MSKTNGRLRKLSMAIPLIFGCLSLIQFVVYAVPALSVDGNSYNIYAFLADKPELSLFGPILAALILNIGALLLFLFITLYLLKYRDTRMVFIKIASVIMGLFQCAAYLAAVIYIAQYDGASLGAGSVISLVLSVLAVAAGSALSFLDKEKKEDIVERSPKQKRYEAIKFVPALVFLCCSLATFLVLSSDCAPISKGVYTDKNDALWSSYPGYTVNGEGYGYENIEPPGWYTYPELYASDAIDAKYHTVYNAKESELDMLNKRAARQNKDTTDNNISFTRYNDNVSIENNNIIAENAYMCGVETEFGAVAVKGSLNSQETVDLGLLHINIESEELAKIYGKVKVDLEKQNRVVVAYNEYAEAYNAEIVRYNSAVEAYNDAVKDVPNAQKLSAKMTMDTYKDWKYVPTYSEYWQILYTVYNTDGETLPADATLYRIPLSYIEDADVPNYGLLLTIFASLALLFAIITVITVIVDSRVTVISDGLEGLSTLSGVIYFLNLLSILLCVTAFGTAFIVSTVTLLIINTFGFAVWAAVSMYRRINVRKHPIMALTETADIIKRCTNRFGDEGLPEAIECPAGPIKGRERKKFYGEHYKYKTEADVFIRKMYKDGQYIERDTDN